MQVSVEFLANMADIDSMQVGHKTLDCSKDYKKFFQAGEIIFREGDAGHCAYIIKRGCVEISTIGNNGKVVLAELAEGELFGEMAIVDNSPRWATVTALKDVALIVITRDSFHHHLENADPVVSMFLHAILGRFKNVHSQLLELDGQHHIRDLKNLDQFHSNTLDESVRATVDALKYEQSMLKGIENNEFELYFQPVINLSTNRVAGFESLIRWNHPKRGLVPPLEFIPLAESNGLIVPIGQWVFEQACLALKEFNNHHDLDFLSINVSGNQFVDKDLHKKFFDFSENLDLPPEKIKLEITESILMDNPEQSKALLDHFCEYGYRIAIDDFGTGYSSLSYLNNFPINTLKIDRSFVSTMHNDNGSMNIVRAIAGLSHSLGMDIVAEGPETEEELQTLKEIGCEYAQGYVISKPLPMKQAMEFMKKY